MNDRHSHRPDDLTPECLTSEEVEEYARSGDLPLCKLGHVEQCEKCEETLTLAASPPEVDLLVSALLDGPQGSPEPVRNRRSVLARLSVLIIVVLSIGWASWVTVANRDLRRQNESLRVENASLESDNADLAAVNESRQPISTWSDEKIENWFSRRVWGNSTQMTELYVLAQLRRFTPGICKAAIAGAANEWKSNGEPRLHVIAARNLVRSFSWQEVETAIRDNAERFGESEEYIIRNIRKAIDE